MSPLFTSGHLTANGLNMYHEIHGADNGGTPLVLIHGGGSTITTTFGEVLPMVAKSKKVIALELQGHGRTKDIGRPEYTFEDDADDVAALLSQLNIKQADFLGFSNGGNTAMQIAIRHSELVRKLIVASGFYKRDGMQPQFWEFMNKGSIADMPQALKDDYLKVTNDPAGLIIMHDKDAHRMLNFKDWADTSLQTIKAPTLILIGDQDVMTPEHAVAMYRLIPDARLSILPGGHGEYLGEITFTKKDVVLITYTVSIVEKFLK